MQEILDFINEFISKNYEFRLACLTERNNERYQKLKAEYEKFFLISTYNNHGREDNVGDDFFNKYQNNLDRIVKRMKVFQIKEYLYINELIYRCYLSSETSDSGNYDKNYIVKKFKNEFKIISIYRIRIDIDKYTTKLDSWKYGIGEKIGKLDKPTKVIKNIPPQDPEQRKEYNKD